MLAADVEFAEISLKKSWLSYEVFLLVFLMKIQKSFSIFFAIKILK